MAIKKVALAYNVVTKRYATDIEIDTEFENAVLNNISLDETYSWREATQVEIDAYNLAQNKQSLSGFIKQARENKQVEPIQYNANQFPAVDKAKIHMNGEINIALYDFCKQKFGAEFTNFMTSRAATWTTVDGKNVNTNIDDLHAIAEQLRIKTRPLYTEGATILNKIKDAPTQAQLDAITIPPIFRTYTVTPPTNGNSGGSLGGDSTLTNGVE